MSLLDAIAAHYSEPVGNGVVQHNGIASTDSVSPFQGTVTLASAPRFGNLLVCIVNASVTGTLTAPTGWTTRIAQTNWAASDNYAVYEKVAGIGESATVTVTFSASVRFSIVVAEIANAVFDTSATGIKSTTGATCTAPGITAGGPDTVLGVVFTRAINGEVFTWNDTFNAIESQVATQATNGTGLSVATKNVANGVATGDATVTYTGGTADCLGLQLGFVNVTPSYSTAVLADAPSVYLRLGETAGSTTAADTSGNSRTGTYAGSPTLAATGLITGDPDTAMSADGVNDVCTLAANNLYYPETNGGVLTIEFWWKGTKVGSNAANASGGLVCANTGSTAKRWCLDVDNNGKLRVRTGGSMNNEGTSVKTINDNVRHHIVYVVTSNTTALLYIDGVLDSTATYEATGSGSPPVTIAENPRATTPFTAGVFDEFAMYPTALSATRIAAHYAAA